MEAYCLGTKFNKLTMGKVVADRRWKIDPPMVTEVPTSEVGKVRIP